ncbi:hypothetical protein [Pseudomonas alcaligenes]|uniref:hypothetical protein n=1 Tax=Aquipseudomonas alcaligenes TaxID=43263 RepID=UPI00358F8CAE
MQKYAQGYNSEIFFADDGHGLQGRIKAMLIEPRAGMETPYLLIDLEPTDGLIKIFRLLVTRHGNLNAEVVFLKVEGNKSLSFGFRYEHPDIFDGPGGKKHAFFHVQPIKAARIGGRDVDLPGATSWLPTSTPTFFMMASNACEVILYAIHSACGWECLETLRIDSYVLRRFLMTGDGATSAF